METCLGHILGKCKDCIPNDDNKKCPYYKGIELAIIEIKEKESANSVV